MAYKITKNILKNGDTIYYINNVNRIPGIKNKLRQTMIWKFSASTLIKEGYNPKVFMQERLDEYRAESKNNVTSMTYTVDLTKELTLSE